jgi:hypothetical protein
VVWAHPGRSGEDGDPAASKVWRNTVTGCGGTGSQCDHSSSAGVFETAVLDRVLSSPSIRASRVAWTDCSPFFAFEGCDIYTRTLVEPDSQLVTNDSDSGVGSPYVDAGRIYWVDDRLGGQDVFMESVSGSALPGPDTIAPAAPTGFTATRLSNRVELAWANPSASDFFRVRILRKSGLVPPASLNDTSAAVVYEAGGTTFTDTDVTPGLRYSYAIVAFDLQPNFSPKAVATTG